MDKKVLIVAKREYLERVRSKLFIVTTIAVPLLMAGAMMFPIYMASRSGASSTVRRIRILDATGAGLGAGVSANLRANIAAGDTVSGPFVVQVGAADLQKAETEAESAVRKANGLNGYLVLNDSTLRGIAARYAGRNASQLTDMDKLRSAVQQATMIVRLEKQGVRKEVVDSIARSRVGLSTERITDRGRGGSGTTGLFVGLAIGVMLLMSIVFHGQNVMRGVLEEKTTRVAEVVISSIKPDSLLMGKVLGVGAVGLTQIVAWLGISIASVAYVAPIMLKALGGPAAAAMAAGPSAAAVPGLSAQLSFGILGIAIVYFLLGFLFYATLMAAAGSMVNSEQEAQQAVMPVMLLLMSAWIFLNPVMLNPTSRVAVVMSWLPWASPIMMPIRMGLTQVSPLSIAGSIGVAAVGSLAAVWLAARIYRVGMLMYGKKPTFAEVAKWVRQS